MVDAEIEVGLCLRALNSVSTLVDTVPVKFEEDGLVIDTVDGANAGAVSLNLKKGAFDSYEAEGSELHLDIEQICRILARFDNDSVVRLTFDEEEHVIELSVDTYSFELAPIHPESARGGKSAKEVEPPAKLILEAVELQQAVRIADMFSDVIMLGVDAKRDVFYINSRGDNNNMAVSFDRDSDKVDIVESEKAHSRYSRGYLAQMTKMIPGTTEITLKLGVEYPAKIEYEIADGAGEVVYGLAPRMD
ncbi:hypothetical protein [Halorubrum sp. SD683]|uniref:hypothetical protein n=1 Tax=Halorubrum sp. SD683 TaxID=1855873 RepID=UPI000A2D672F|nr:hypothetical protein [Halorubrum sp. SD683]OTF01896.1 hypothetical protein B9G49_01230 [Halorubrum sp. SD683]